MTTPQPESAAEKAPDRRTPRQKAFDDIAHRLSAEATMSTGARAELRRLNPRGPLAEPALHALLARYVSEPYERDELMRAWGLLVHVLALAAPDHLRGAEPLGRALYAIWQDKDRRLVNLLDADFDSLAVLLPRAVRFLVAKGRSVRARDAADLVFSRLDEDDEDWAERVRRRIAADYYRAQARAERADEPA